MDKFNKGETVLIAKILKRVQGFPTDIYDNSFTTFLYCGDKVKVYINEDFDIISGIVKYDICEDKYYVRLNGRIKNFNNGKRNLYLDLSTSDKVCCCKYSNIIERLCETIQPDYAKCIKLLKNNEFISLFQFILDLFYEDRLYLDKNELLFIKNKIKNNNNKIKIKVEINIEVKYSDNQEYVVNSEYVNNIIKNIDKIINDDKKIQCNDFQTKLVYKLI